MSDGSATRVSLAGKSPLLEVMDVSVFFSNKLDVWNVISPPFPAIIYQIFVVEVIFLLKIDSFGRSFSNVHLVMVCNSKPIKNAGII